MPERVECKCLIGGKWVEAQADQYGEVWNPSLGEVIARVPLCKAGDVDRAVQAAGKAFPAWSQTPAPDRARVMFRFRQRLIQHADDIARSLTREHGKTESESRASLQRGIDVVEFACGLPSLLMGETMGNIAEKIDCETTRLPLGVVAGITPFNFPAMVPLWMFPIAVTCGNCFILKPSEQTPLTAIRLGELLLEAGLPEGVFSIVHGGKECVDALLTHPGIRAISFVGSTAVAKHVYETGTAHGKRVQAAGGAKNHIIVMPDAPVEPTLAGILNSAFGCSGQRCMAGSLVITVGDAGEKVITQLSERASKMKIGRTDNGAPVDMGPVISKKHLERVVGYIETGEREGARLALDGRQVEVFGAGDGFFVGPTILDDVQPNMCVAREEIFGPVLSVVRSGTLEEALEIGATCEYGNGAVIFTRSGWAAREFKHRFNAGMIGVNVGVPAPLAWFPFTGWNGSFFGDLHIQGKEGICFYTQQRMVLTRWFEELEQPASDPIWRSDIGN